MSYSNGKFPDSALEAIPGGRLAKDAARAWNAPGGPADNGCVPTGSNSSYRTYEKQVEYWNMYQAGTGNLAAYPGTSNHGLGLAVDLATPAMRAWIDQHGAKYGWQKTEAMSEWWHVNFVGGVTFPPPFKAIKHGQRGLRVLKVTKKLAFIRGERSKRYIKRRYFKFKDPVVQGVKQFQKDHGLAADGVIGPNTFDLIEKTFKRQWKQRHG